MIIGAIRIGKGRERDVAVTGVGVPAFGCPGSRKAAHPIRDSLQAFLRPAILAPKLPPGASLFLHDLQLAAANDTCRPCAMELLR